MNPRVRVLLAVSLSALLAACPKATRPPPTATEPTAPAEVPTADLRGATVFEVDPKDSEIRILVYRAGTLARFGHNHVMTTAALSGKVWINPTLAKSGLALAFPVGQLTVDDPAARKASGEDFPADVAASDREGTRTNMLRAEVLDAERFPSITLRSVKVTGTQAAPQILARITIRDASRDIEVPAAMTIDGSRLTATGEFAIKQTDFGIKPFSVGLGTLQVRDELQIRFKVVALRQ